MLRLFRGVSKIGQPSFELGRSVDLLADSTRSAMIALYDVETATVNVHHGAVDDKFQLDRQILRDLWEKIKRYLQQCHTYGEDFASLAYFLETRTVAECSLYINSLSNEANRILRETKGILKEYDVQMKKIRKHGNEVAQYFPASSERYNPIHDTRSRSGLRGKYAQAVSVSLNPDGRRAIGAFVRASIDMRTHLSGLLGFWEEERSIYLSKSAAFKRHGEKWKGYGPALMSAITSVAAAADAVAVHSMGER